MKLSPRLPSKTELDASISAARLHKSDSRENLCHCLVQSIRHFRIAFEFLRVFFYAAHDYLKAQATIAKAQSHAGLEWLLRRGNNASCPQSEAKNQGLSNAKKVDAPAALEDPLSPCQNNQNPNTQSKSDGARMSPPLVLLCLNIGIGGYLLQSVPALQHIVPQGWQDCREAGK